MQTPAHFLRRNFEPLILSTQVFIDLGVLLLACWLGYLIGGHIGNPKAHADLEVYRQIWALMSAVCLVSFHAFGMYSPVKSLLNMEEYKGIAKATVVSYFVFWTLLILLVKAHPANENTFLQPLVWLHQFFDLDSDPINRGSFSRLTISISFALILVLTTTSRFFSFKYIQTLHRRGIGNRNVLIYGADEWGCKLRSKFLLVPTLGLNMVGFITENRKRIGEKVERIPILGGFDDLEQVVGQYKVSEVFVALPDQNEDRVMEILVECDRIGVKYHVVPRFHHLLSYKIRIQHIDSIPLITRADRRRSLVSVAIKRAMDIVVSSVVLVLGAPLFVGAAILIRRESPGPALFIQNRVGKDEKLFPMYKFRTMHSNMGGDAPAPDSPYDPRITKIGRYLRRYSLDELPQFLNVLQGSMSLVGPRPEMPFIVEGYNSVQLERLRVKPGITGLWQISYARQSQIHDNIDYDLYYIEHQSFLLDLVVISLTGVAVVKGTGAF